jgi:hypothetical protein
MLSWPYLAAMPKVWGKKAKQTNPIKANPEKPLVFRPWERKSLFLNIYPPLLKGLILKILID